MKLRRLLTSLTVLLAVLGCTTPAAAHRLDEYLQATLLSIDRDRVTVEIGLTAGVNVAPQILASIDSNSDGRISAAEADAYARQMLRSVTVTIDERRVPIALEQEEFPELSEMSLGMGTIHLRAVAKVPSATAGRHQLSYLNSHRHEVSVYLVNALVPTDRHVQIVAEQRDAAQRSLTLEYNVASDLPWVQASWLLAGLGMIGALVMKRRTRGDLPSRA
jgi:hypothetical protein